LINEIILTFHELVAPNFLTQVPFIVNVNHRLEHQSTLSVLHVPNTKVYPVNTAST